MDWAFRSDVLRRGVFMGGAMGHLPPPGPKNEVLKWAYSPLLIFPPRPIKKVLNWAWSPLLIFVGRKIGLCPTPGKILPTPLLWTIFPKFIICFLGGCRTGCQERSATPRSWAGKIELKTDGRFESSEKIRDGTIDQASSIETNGCSSATCMFLIFC